MTCDRSVAPVVGDNQSVNFAADVVQTSSRLVISLQHHAKQLRVVLFVMFQNAIFVSK